MRLLIYDKDTEYVNKLTELLAEVIRSDFEVHYCIDFCDIDEIIVEKSIDILLIEEEAWLKYSDKEKDLLIILLCNNLVTINKAELECIYKYQCVHNISKKIIDTYLDYKPGMISLNDTNIAKTILVYSPIGGSGKTTISFALSQMFNKSGLKVFYLNLETFCSDRKQTTRRGDLSKLLKLAHQKKSLMLDIKTQAKKDSLSNYSYISSVDSYFDLVDLESNDLRYLVEQIKKTDIAEILIIDSDSTYNEKMEELFSLADIIYLISIDTELANTKFQTFKKLTPFYKNYLDKTKFILNKTNQVGKSKFILIPKYNEINDSQVIIRIAEEVDFEVSAI